MGVSVFWGNCWPPAKRRFGAVGAGVAGRVAGRVLGVAGRVGAGVVCGEGLPTKLLVFYHWIAGLQWIFFVHCF